jgi:hypothetical protein
MHLVLDVSVDVEHCLGTTFSERVGFESSPS